MPLEPEALRLTGAERHEYVQYRWYHKVTSLVFIVFALELGAFLIIFPWLEYWDRNFFSAVIPEWHRYWENAYLRGAVSGLGAVNIYIAILEIFRLRRFSTH